MILLNEHIKLAVYNHNCHYLIGISVADKGTINDQQTVDFSDGRRCKDLTSKQAISIWQSVIMSMFLHPGQI